MAVSVFPALLAAGYTQAQAALSTVRVSYGMVATEDPGDYLMLGGDDPDADWIVASIGSREFEGVGLDGEVSESGEIPCYVLSWNGDSDVRLAVETVYTIAEQVITIFRNAPNLGLIQVDWTLPGSEMTCEYQLDDDGVKARLPFSIRYQALI